MTMVQGQPVPAGTKAVDSWIRRNVIDAAPLWIQFLRSALANVHADLGGGR
ncbi:MAG: hypothetical protein ABSG81_06135 [Acidimicrobiales bacterium]|jgi:hypothetical protein